MRTAYLDCFSGISGDMFLGALLDAGLPFETLKQALSTLPLKGYSIEMKREARNNLMAASFIVTLKGKKHEHRGMKEIREIINRGKLSEAVKKKSIKIFESIAEAEGKIHGLSPEEVHFHEVGAVDSIIDIVGAAFGIEFMQINSLSVSNVPLGSGFMETGHGRIPIPSPATVALLKGIPVHSSGLEYELVTPTGAALIREFASSFVSMPPMIIDSVGYGAGKRILPDRPNLLRMIIGVEQTGSQVETIVLIEANLDDTNPEWMGFLMEDLFEAGALDVVFCPIQMKKNRPGIQIQVMGNPQDTDSLIEILMRETTTIGVRFRYGQRKILERSNIEIDSPWGRMKVKKIVRPDGTFFIQPEFESCKKIAKEFRLPLKEVYYWVYKQTEF